MLSSGSVKPSVFIFHWDANSKVMFAYEKPKTDGFTDPDDNIFTLRYQYKF